ncbi:hypothetical protein D3C87_1164950 [compost metagenome]
MLAYCWAKGRNQVIQLKICHFNFLPVCPVKVLYSRIFFKAGIISFPIIDVRCFNRPTKGSFPAAV